MNNNAQDPFFRHRARSPKKYGSPELRVNRIKSLLKRSSTSHLLSGAPLAHLPRYRANIRRMRQFISRAKRRKKKTGEKHKACSGLLSVISVIELARLAYGRNFAMVARPRCVCISEGRLREYCVSIGHTRANRGR